MKQNKQVTRTRHGVDWCYVGCLSIRNGTGSGGSRGVLAETVQESIWRFSKRGPRQGAWASPWKLSEVQTLQPFPLQAGWTWISGSGVPRVFAQALLFLMNAKLGNHCKDSLFQSQTKARKINENAVCLKMMFQKKIIMFQLSNIF